MQVNFLTETKIGTLIRVTGEIDYRDGRILFLKSPFALKNEIKAMEGSKWRPEEKRWSVADTPRNRFQLDYLMGKDTYAWFDRETVKHAYSRPLMDHQRELADHFLTYHYGIMAAEMGCGKTLAAQEVMEQSGVKNWWWVGPKSSLPNIERELHKWNFDPSVNVRMMTYERLVREMEEKAKIPQGVIFDESSRVKKDGTKRTNAARQLADAIRAKYGNDGYVILMSGTPSPKTPIDWWTQSEIAYPGFLKEGSPKALERRLAFMELKQFDGGVSFNDRIGWRDDERKCDVCGMFEQDGPHSFEDSDYHKFVPSRNEVAYMYERLKGLVIIKHKKDCLTLPEKHYRKIVCQPSASILRVAKAIAQSSQSAVQAMMLLRELSDGFQYRDKIDGTTKCTHCEDGKVFEWFHGEETYEQIDMLTPEKVATLERREVNCPVCDGSGKMPKIVRETKEIPCPKEAALKDLLDECEDVGRVVIFAGFTGSVDRVTNLCLKQQWDVVRLDGRGYQVTRADGQPVEEQGLDYWANRDNLKVAFVAHPESGGMSLTLTEASMAIYWSNSLKPEYRIQSEDRIHRIGADFNRGCTIVDLTHLPSDERVLEIIQSNRRLELMTMGEAFNGINWGDVHPSLSATA